MLNATQHIALRECCARGGEVLSSHWFRIPHVITVSILIALLNVVFFYSPSAYAEGVFSRLFPESRVSGYFKNETAYRYAEPRTYTKIRNILFLEKQTNLYKRHSLFASAWMYHDLVYDVFDYDTIAARSERDSDQPLAFVETLPQEKDSNVAEFRELYLDFAFDDFDLRLGKQFIVWGVLPGVRVVDEVNPMDFRELILPDVLDYRVPLWSAKLDYYHSSGDYQLIWIPDVQFHKPAPRGSEWELLQEVPGTRYPARSDIKNTEVGMRYSFEFFRAQLALSYFYTWDDYPIIFRNVKEGQTDENSTAGPPEGDPEFFPRFGRLHMFGLTFTRPVYDAILNSELAFVRGKYWGLSFIDRDNDDFLDHQGVLKRDHIRFGLSIDLNILHTEISPGITQQIILEHDPAMIQAAVDTTFNLFIRKKLENSSAVFEMLAIYLMDLEETYLRPEFKFNPAEKVTLGFGLDLFTGEKSQSGTVAVRGDPTDLDFVAQSTHFLGNFNNNDRIFMELKISF